MDLGGIRLCVDERYTCESLEHFSHTPLARPVEATIIVFGGGGVTVSDSSLEVVKSGVVDAVAMWFTLNLEDPALHNEKVAKGTRIGAYELTRKLGEVWYAASLFV